MDRLPTELLLKIFSLVPQRELLHARSVCRRWMAIASLPEFSSNIQLNVTERNLGQIASWISDGIMNLERYPHLRLIGLSNSSDLVKRVLGAVGVHGRSLCLVNSNVFKDLAILLPHLQQLTINCDRLHCSETLYLNLNAFADLTELNLAGDNVSPELNNLMLVQLTDDRTTLRLQRLYLQFRNENLLEEELMLEVIKSHAATLTHLGMHFSAVPSAGMDSWRDAFPQMIQLQSLKLSGTCRYFVAVFQGLPQTAPLSQINLSGVVRVHDILLKLITCKWRTKLTHLELMFCGEITDNGLLELHAVRDTLRVLDISYCSKLKPISLLGGIVSSRNTTLSELYLDNHCDIDENSLCTLAVRLPNLRTLSLANCYNGATDVAVARFLRHQRQLRCLNLDDCVNLTDKGLRGIRRQLALQELSLRNCHALTDQVLIDFLKLGKLRKLQLGYSPKITAKGIKQLVKNCPCIEELIITSCNCVDDTAVLYIAKGLRRLRRLNLSNCRKLSQLTIGYIEQYCTALEQLTLYGMYNFTSFDVQAHLACSMPALTLLM